MTRSTILLLSSCILSANAFTAPKLEAVRLSSVSLNVGAALDWDGWNSNADEAMLMKRAYDCAHSDSCSLDDARASLDNVIHIQSNCASGALLGSGVCENADSVSEIVANLRRKIEIESQRVIVVETGVNLVAISMASVLLAIFAAGSTPIDSDAFTPQEWWWAIRDGYLPTMIEHYFRNGGLASMDSEMGTTAFALQEWWWAARDGYLPTMFEHFFRNGGLVSANYDVDTTPFTMQEWWWAARDGYLPTMFQSLYRDGGLALLDSDAGTSRLTMQEWVWAAQGGYLEQLSNHYFQNGGL